MDTNLLFRLLFGLGVAIFAPVGAWHRIQSRTNEKLDRRQEGLFILITLRATGIVGILGVFAYLFYPQALAFATFPVPTIARWIGVFLGLLSGLLVTWTLRCLGRNLTDTVVTRKAHTLITHGPYRWVRHPFYSAAALAVPASALTSANWFFLVTGTVVFVLLAVRAAKE